jgi:hypothetical protein
MAWPAHPGCSPPPQTQGAALETPHQIDGAATIRAKPRLNKAGIGGSIASSVKKDQKTHNKKFA